MPIPMGQNWFIKQMIALGYPHVDEGGQCFGIAAMASHEFLVNQMGQFDKRMGFLSQLTLKDMDKLRNARLEGAKLNEIITKSGQSMSIWEIMAFYDGVHLYQQPDKYPDILPGKSSQHGRAAAKYISPSLSDGDPPIKLRDPFCGAYNEKELDTYLRQLQTHLPCKTALALSSINHAINLNYDSKTKEWTLVNANRLPSCKFKEDAKGRIIDSNGKLLSKEIISAFNAGRKTTGYAIFSTSIFSTTSHQFELETAFKALATSKAWTDIHLANTIDKATRHDAFKADLAIVAAKIGELKVINELRAYADLETAFYPETTPAYVAAQNGHHEVIAALADEGVDLSVKNKGGFSLAHLAAINDHHEVIGALARAGVNVNEANRDGLTPAHLAAFNGCPEVIAALARVGAKLSKSNRNGHTPAHLAALSNHCNIITALSGAGDEARKSLDASDNNGMTPAYMAAELGDHNTIAALAAAGADLSKKSKSGVTPACIGAQNGHVDVIAELGRAGVDFNIPNNDGVTAAMRAAQRGKVAVIEVLRKYEADFNQVDNDGKTVAMYAAESGHVSCIQQLNEYGIHFSQPDAEGRTAAMYAAKYGRVDVIQQLKEYGVNFNQADNNGKTVAMYAAESGDIESIQKLKEYGASFTERDTAGKTAAMYAAKSGQVDAIEQLKQYDVDFSQTDHEGNTSAMYAVKYGDADCIMKLHEYKVDFTQINIDGITPAAYAAQYCDARSLIALHRCGVDFSQVNTEGMTPVMHAIKFRQGPEVMTALRQCKATLNSHLSFDAFDTFDSTLKAVRLEVETLDMKQHPAAGKRAVKLLDDLNALKNICILSNQANSVEVFRAACLDSIASAKNEINLNIDLEETFSNLLKKIANAVVFVLTLGHIKNVAPLSSAGACVDLTVKVSQCVSGLWQQSKPASEPTKTQTSTQNVTRTHQR